MKNKDALARAYAINVLKDLLEKDMFISKMVKEKGYSSSVLVDTLRYLTTLNLVKTYTEKVTVMGNSRVMYTLTPKGQEVAKKLKEIDKIMNGREEEISLEEEFGGMQGHFLVHVNAIDNIVRIKDGNRIADVYVRNIGNKIKLYCDLCGSDSCIHVNFAYSLTRVRELIEKFR